MADEALSHLEYQGWLTPSDASAYARKCLGTTDTITTLWGLVANGVVRMAALTHSVATGPKGTPTPMPGPTMIPLSRLPHYSVTGSDFWTGTLRFWVPGGEYGKSHTYTYFNVRLDSAALIATLPPPPPPPDPPLTAPIIEPVPSQLAALPPVPVLATKPAGGRPPKAFWEALWIEMACQVWAGEIGPESKQAEIQDAMDEWVTANEHEASPATLKNAARALLQALQAKKGKNP